MDLKKEKLQEFYSISIKLLQPQVNRKYSKIKQGAILDRNEISPYHEDKIYHICGEMTFALHCILH